MILTGKSLSTLFLISDVTTKEAISGVPIFCLSIIPNLAKFTENEDRDVTDVLAESSFCSKGNLFEDVQQVEEEETTDNSTSSFIHEKDISNLFEDNQQFESISVNLASASPESVSSENEGNESISKLSRLNFSGEKTLINVPFCSGYERNEEDTNSSSCLDSEIEKETHFESERNSISEDDECETERDREREQSKERKGERETETVYPSTVLTLSQHRQTRRLRRRPRHQMSFQICLKRPTTTTTATNNPTQCNTSQSGFRRVSKTSQFESRAVAVLE